MKKSTKILLGFLFGIIALFWFYPFIIVIINALKGKRGIFQNRYGLHGTLRFQISKLLTRRLILQAVSLTL